MPDPVTRLNTAIESSVVNRHVRLLTIGSFLFQLGCGANDVGILDVDEPTDPPPVLQSAELCTDNPSPDLPMFPDDRLEAAVRVQLLIPSWVDLTCDLLSGLTSLAAASSGIENLVGIESLTSLAGLYLPDNSIIDISALSELTKLKELNLTSNSIADISGLSGLTRLTSLWLADGSITDISALSGLTSLASLDLTANSITDISELGGLTSLTSLWLGESSIANISALEWAHQPGETRPPQQLDLELAPRGGQLWTRDSSCGCVPPFVVEGRQLTE